MADLLSILVSRMRFLTTAEKILLRDIAGSIDVLENMNIHDIESITGRCHKIKEYSLKKALNEAEKAQKILASGNIKCLFFEQQNYPPQLGEIYNPPFMLYYRGNLPQWNKPSAAVVGTRLASGAGLDAAFKLGFEFAGCGIPVVSGLAMGIDSAAHSGAVAGGGCTVAVLGSGPDRIYPAVNRRIAASILEHGGAVLSEYLPGELPQKHHFPERNRIISGLSRAVVVVEAPGRSGALITADFALEQGRDLFMHEIGVKSMTGTGRNGKFERMIFEGAPVIGNIGEILAEWGITEEVIRDRKLENEIKMTSAEAGSLMADRLRKELEGCNIMFNGNNFRRAML